MRRRAVLSRWGLLEGEPTVLDIGCGIGQYASVTSGRYVGVDLNEPYVEHARRRRGDDRHTFRCVDAVELVAEDERFDLVLMVDFLHHLPDEAAVSVLETARELTRGHVVALEPVTEQSNRARTLVHRQRPRRAHAAPRAAAAPVRSGGARRGGRRAARPRPDRYAGNP